MSHCVDQVTSNANITWEDLEDYNVITFCDTDRRKMFHRKCLPYLKRKGSGKTRSCGKT